MHDDRLGAYARLAFVTDEDGSIDHQRIKLLPRSDGFESLEIPMTFSDALVPLYPKLRLTAEELIEFALDLHPPIRHLASSESLYVEPRFLLGGDYLSELQRREVDVERLVDISSSMTLSRYVGALSWFVDEDWVADAVYDTTDLRRDIPGRPPLLALIPKHPGWIEQLEVLRDLRFGPIPLIA